LRAKRNLPKARGMPWRDRAPPRRLMVFIVFNDP